MSWGDGWGAEAWGGGFASDMGGLQGGNTGGTDRHGDQIGGGGNKQGGTPSGWTAGGPEAGSWVGKSRPDTQPGIGAAPTADITGAGTSTTTSSPGGDVYGDRGKAYGLGVDPKDIQGQKTPQDQKTLVAEKNKAKKAMENVNVTDAMKYMDDDYQNKRAAYKQAVSAINDLGYLNEVNKDFDTMLGHGANIVMAGLPLNPVTAAIQLGKLTLTDSPTTLDTAAALTGTTDSYNTAKETIGSLFTGKTNTTKGASSNNNNNDSISGESGGNMGATIGQDTLGASTTTTNTSTSVANTNTGGWQGGSEGMGESPTSITQTPSSSQFTGTNAQSNNVDIAVLDPEQVKDDLTVGTNRNTVRAFQGSVYA